MNFCRRFLINSPIKRCYYTVKTPDNAPVKPSLLQQIAQKIKTNGPITVAEYMKVCLTHPVSGYYISRDVFGQSGDFITSPELHQIFGEMIAVWFLNEWSKMGKPTPFQIVEMGPGRGSLSQDLLRVFDHFEVLKGASLHLVELSPVLSDLQARKLCFQSHNVDEQNAPFFKQGITHQGIPVRWYRHYEEVPDGFTILIAHEFFDALPIHKFQKTENGYREVLIDVNEDNGFRFISARDVTPSQKFFIKQNEQREHFEISPESWLLVKKITDKIIENGGLALIADYGHNGDKTDTFRAFKQHQLHDPLVEPGSADLTADVDFARLKEVATESGDIIAFGPVTQRDFLLKLGIEHRFEALKHGLDEEQIKALDFSFKMMTDNDKMGERFKFLSLFPSVVKPIFDKVPVAGFT